MKSGSRDSNHGTVPYSCVYRFKLNHSNSRLQESEKSIDRGGLFVCTHEICSASNPFYEAFNKLLCRNGFDAFVEDLREQFCADGKGRPGIPPGVYFRMLTVGV